MKNKNIAFASIFILIGAIFRLLPHPPNVTPIAAMAFVGGIYLNKKYLAFLVPLAVLFFSDFILNNTINRVFFTDQTGLVIFSDYMIWVYIAFILTVLIGMFLKDRSKTQKIIFGTLLSSVGFYLITNFGVWMTSTLYPKTAGGLMTSFTAAIPFFRNTLLGNTLFISVFVLSIEALLKYSFNRKLA